ncbi:MAG: GNAT family N-acetyltransferase [Candidatus Hermodarchaeota archaeon]
MLPEWRRKRVGSKLAQYIFNFARNKNYEKIVIFVRSGILGQLLFIEV